MKLELKEFLKKYSTVPNTFLDEFYDMQITNNVSTDFKIDLDILSKWLDARKDHLKETLLTSYNENIDYTIKQEINKGRGGKPTDRIMLTNDCFKRLCMLSRSKKAEMVRTYFISLEKLIDKYKDHIIKSMEEKIKQLENNQKPIVNPQSGVVYVLKTDKSIQDLYKIGKTKMFKNRMKTHNSSHNDNIEVIFVYETNDIDKVEGCLKVMLKDKQYKKRKEFYEVDIDLIKELISKCDELQLKIKNKPKKFKQDGGYFLMFAH